MKFNINALVLLMVLFFSVFIKIQSQITYTVGRSQDYATLQAACAAIPQPIEQDYTIILCEDISPDSTINWFLKSGTNEHNIKITCLEGVKIKGTNLTRMEDYPAALRIYYSNYIILENLVFEDFNGATTAMMLQIAHGNYNTVKNCTFSDFEGYSAQAAISIWTSSNNKVENCTFSNLNRQKRDDVLHAIYITVGSNNNMISGNTVNYCSGDPFVASKSSNHNIFDGNIVVQSGGPGYYAADPGDNSCSNNIVKNTICMGPDPENGYYGSFIKKFRGGIDDNGDLDSNINWIDGGGNSFSIHSTNMFLDAMIGEDAGKVIFLDFPLVWAFIKYEENLIYDQPFEGLTIRRYQHNEIINSRWASDAIYFEDESNKPRKIPPFKIVTFLDESLSICPDSRDHECEINLEK